MGHKKPTGALILRWVLYIGLLAVAAVLQFTPKVFVQTEIWPLFILPVCFAITANESGFAGSALVVAGGLLWDVSAGRITGFFAVLLLLLCFGASCLWKLYLQNTLFNFMLITATSSFIIVNLDFLIFYFLKHYPNAANQYLRFVLPEIMATLLISPIFWWAARKINQLTLEKSKT